MILSKGTAGVFSLVEPKSGSRHPQPNNSQFSLEQNEDPKPKSAKAQFPPTMRVYGSLFLPWMGLSLVHLTSHADANGAAHYTAGDDASWAVHSADVSSVLGTHVQSLYSNFIEGCNKAMLERRKKAEQNTCEAEEAYRTRMNREQPPSVYNYTHNGYQKIKTPKELFDTILEFYNRNKEQAHSNKEWATINTYHNLWETEPTIIRVNDFSVPGGGSVLQNKIWEFAKPVLEQWTGMELAPVSLYGIRLYHRGSVLAPHVDRMPLVTSAIINVDQDVDEPWPLEVYGHDGKATNITMEPGDMVLYESHSVIHGRPFPLVGNYYANVFVHFEPVAPLDPDDPDTYDPERDIPPYLIPDSDWEIEWMRGNPQGWQGKAMDPRQAAIRGDIKALHRIGAADPQALHQPDENGWHPLHEAVRAGQVDAVQVLLLNGAQINHPTQTGVSPLNIALQYLGADHQMTKFLQGLGAVDFHREL